MPARKQTEREAREARDRLRRYTARQSVNATQTKRRRRDNILGVASVLIIASLATVGQIFYFSGGPGAPTPTASAGAGQNIGDVPDPSLAEAKTWTGTMELNQVALDFSLDGAAAPQAVSSFLASAEQGYYQGKTCHRLVVGATAGLIQCGSLDGTGSTDPSYSYGPIENPGAGGVYPVGTIAIARTGGDAYSQGRQFFIVFDESTLPNDAAGGYTIIGRVTKGLDELRTTIADAGVSGGVEDGPPLVSTTITALTID